jgi:HSP20 family protein
MAERTPTRKRRRRLPSLFESSPLESWMREFLLPVWDETEERASTLWAPQMDMIETESDYEVQMDLPGLSKDDITIEAENHRLTVRGERKEERREGDENYVRMERRTGRFYRSIALPDAARPEQAEASVTDGVLTVRVPKAKEKAAKKIEIA